MRQRRPHSPCRPRCPPRRVHLVQPQLLRRSRISPRRLALTLRHPQHRSPPLHLPFQPRHRRLERRPPHNHLPRIFSQPHHPLLQRRLRQRSRVHFLFKPHSRRPRRRLPPPHSLLPRSQPHLPSRQNQRLRPGHLVRRSLLFLDKLLQLRNPLRHQPRLRHLPCQPLPHSMPSLLRPHRRPLPPRHSRSRHHHHLLR